MENVYSKTDRLITSVLSAINGVVWTLATVFTFVFAVAIAYVLFLGFLKLVQPLVG